MEVDFGCGRASATASSGRHCADNIVIKMLMIGRFHFYHIMRYFILFILL